MPLPLFVEQHFLFAVFFRSRFVFVRAEAIVAGTPAGGRRARRLVGSPGAAPGRANGVAAGAGRGERPERAVARRPAVPERWPALDPGRRQGATGALPRWPRQRGRGAVRRRGGRACRSAGPGEAEAGRGRRRSRAPDRGLARRNRAQLGDGIVRRPASDAGGAAARLCRRTPARLARCRREQRAATAEQLGASAAAATAVPRQARRQAAALSQAGPCGTRGAGDRTANARTGSAGDAAGLVRAWTEPRSQPVRTARAARRRGTSRRNGWRPALAGSAGFAQDAADEIGDLIRDDAELILRFENAAEPVVEERDQLFRRQAELFSKLENPCFCRSQVSSQRAVRAASSTVTRAITALKCAEPQPDGSASSSKVGPHVREHGRRFRSSYVSS